MGNVDTIKAAWDAFQRGDPEGVLESYADDARWDGWNSKDLPGGGRFEGKQEIGRMLGHWGPDNFEEFRATPDEFHEDGDVVIVLGHAEGRTKAGGSFTAPFVHVNRLRGGNVVEVLALTDTALLRDAMGGSG
jgi:ketosteroid isomerase-like protein